MALDLYSPCPCGSGKKVKWCCQHILADIEHAFEQEELGQHEAALRIMDEVIRRHPDKPEAWGRKAQLLFTHGKIDEGEEVLQKAFDLNPNYPSGLLLRARLRFQEGEVAGALLLARRAAEAFDPEAHDHLAQVYVLIAECEMARNRPVAAHAAMRILVRLQPGDPQLREVVEANYGPESRLPECARRVYTFQSPPAGVAGERRQAWDRALSQVEGPRLAGVAAAFERLTAQDPGDAAAWHNLAVVQAWLGENRKALDSLDRYLELEQHDRRAEAAAALGEVLRCGQGLEDLSDYHEHRVELQVRDFNAVGKLLQEWNDTGRMVVVRGQEQAAVTAMLLEPVTASVVTTATAVSKERKLAGYLLLVRDRLALWGPREETFNRLRDELKTRTALGVSEGPVQTLPAHFSDVVAEGLLFPENLLAPGAGSEESARQRVREYAEGYFEGTWVHRPLRSLSGVPPVDAAGHRTLRKKLLGVVRFLQDCAALGVLTEYDFDRLRRKLGQPAAGAPVAPEAAAGGAAPPDVSALGAAELAALPVDRLTDEQLETAYQAAQKLDAGELSGHFARALVARPVAAGAAATDRFPWYAYLVQQALGEGKTDEALGYLAEGQRVDSEHNEGRRRNDYELRRGQVHVRRGEADLAHDVFTRLIGLSPDSVKYRGSAAEGMLSLRQPERALRFAEEGLAVARQKQDRDAEQHMLELVDAARRQAGGK